MKIIQIESLQSFFSKISNFRITSDFEFIIIPYFQQMIYWSKNAALLHETSKY